MKTEVRALIHGYRGRRRFALSILKEWGCPVVHSGTGMTRWQENDHQLQELLVDGHQAWRRLSKRLSRHVRLHRLLNCDWMLVRRQFARRGVHLHA